MKQVPICARVNHKQRVPVAYAMVDDEDYELVMKSNWSIRHANHGSAKYAQRRYKKGQYTLMHQVILNAAGIDHIDGNGLNNQKSNLRIVPHKRNMENRTGLNSNNTSGYRGVTYNKQKKKWQAQLKHHCKQIMIGRYDTKEEAHEPVKKKREELKFLNKN